MSTLTDVLHNPATAAAELTRLREVERKALAQSEYIQTHGLTEYELARKDAEIDALRERNRRLTWALRAIDTRLHREMNGESLAATVYLVNARTLRQMCNVAVSATAERPEDA